MRRSLAALAGALVVGSLLGGCVSPSAGPTRVDPFYGYGPYGPYYYGYGPPDSYRCAARSRPAFAPIYPRYDRHRHKCP